MNAIRTCFVAMAFLFAGPASADDASDGAPVIVEGAREFVLNIPGRDSPIRLLVWQPPGDIPSKVIL